MDIINKMFKKYKIICFLMLIVACSKSEIKEVYKVENRATENYKNRALQVYTTARGTTLRLTKTSEQTFKDKVQPLETEIAVFVNPKKTFQEYLGIGGAITDASAEVFSTLIL